LEFDGLPLIIGWELTLACDLRCSHCGSSAGLPRKDELTTRECLEICDQFPELLVQEVDFTGGEPLLRRDWAEIALHLKDLGISTNILTNGLDLDRETVLAMKEAGIGAVGISLDGLEQTHDRIRCREGSYRSVIRSLGLFDEVGLEYNVITTVNSLNIQELVPLYSVLRSVGARCWRLQPLIPSGRALASADLRMMDEWIVALGDFFRRWKSRSGMQLIYSHGLEYVDDTPWRGCPAGKITCGITSDGKIKGCLSLPDSLVEGDLRQRDLWDIWFDPGAFSYTRAATDRTLGENCISCDKGQECRGGCSSGSWAGTGQFHNDPFCFYRLHKMR